MKHHRVPASRIDIPAIIDVGLALRALAKTSPRVRLHVSSFITEVLGEDYGPSLAIFIAEVVAYVERSQRFADRFRSWRHSKRRDARPLGTPDRIGAPQRPVRRIRESVAVEGVLSTVLAVRALDREGGKPREPRFITDVCAAYDGWASSFIYALLVYAERDRRVARRFRSWRRAKVARMAAPPRRAASTARRHQ